ncbi:hypothetical protein PSAB6_60180 [Paraburkholderia sabiae]|nr:hypothetical protein PSAB6_60180 [Paraburkholderia sabiae]
MFRAKAATLHLKDERPPLALRRAFLTFENIHAKETMPALAGISSPCRPHSSTRTPPA